jgi:endo-1,4-beta-xylanase
MSVTPYQMTAVIAAWLLFATTVAAQEIQTTLQISPQGGGKCAEVPNREFVRDQQLQMQDCNSSPAQTFTYDQARTRLTIGGLCVDANGSQPGDLVKLWPCDGGANQVWEVEQKGTFAKLIGTSGLCLDIRYGSTASGAPLQSWTCGDAEPNQLWSFQRK